METIFPQYLSPERFNVLVKVEFLHVRRGSEAVALRMKRAVTFAGECDGAPARKPEALYFRGLRGPTGLSTRLELVLGLR